MNISPYLHSRAVKDPQRVAQTLFGAWSYVCKLWRARRRYGIPHFDFGVVSSKDVVLNVVPNEAHVVLQIACFIR